MSLRSQIVCLIAAILIASLTVEGLIVSFNASRSVQTEMNSALRVGRQIVNAAVARFPDAADRQRALETLVASFKGHRHLRMSLTGVGTPAVIPTLEESRFGMVPSWFIRFLGITPVTVRVPVVFAGRDAGSIIIETDPVNEIVEVWNDLGNSLIVLTLFFGFNTLLIYFFIGLAAFGSAGQRA